MISGLTALLWREWSGEHPQDLDPAELMAERTSRRRPEPRPVAHHASEAPT